MSEEKPPETPEVEPKLSAEELSQKLEAKEAEVKTLTDKIKAKDDDLASKEEKINQLTEETKMN